MDYELKYVTGKKGQTKSKVIRQRPAAGKNFKPGTKIVLTISEEDYARDYEVPEDDGSGDGDGGGGGSVDLPNHIPGNLCRKWWC